MRKRTTTQKLNTAIANNLLQITKAERHYKSSNRIDELSAETFTENFSPYVSQDALQIVSVGIMNETINQTII